MGKEVPSLLAMMATVLTTSTTREKGLLKKPLTMRTQAKRTKGRWWRSRYREGGDKGAMPRTRQPTTAATKQALLRRPLMRKQARMMMMQRKNSR